MLLSATDGFGSGSTANVAITVLSAADQAAALRSRVAELQSAGVLNKGQANSLLVKADLRGNQGDVGRVRAFLQEVRALRHSGLLTPEQADTLIALCEILLLSLTR